MIEFEVIKSILIFGAIAGGMYALLAVGFSMIYGVTEITNLAHGALFMIGSYVYFFLASSYGGIQINVLPALIISAVVVAIVGAIVYRLVMDPVIEDPVSVMVVTLSVAMILSEVMFLGFGGHHLHLPSIWEGFLEMLGKSDILILWDIQTTYSQVLSAALSIVLFAVLIIFVEKTRIGRAMKALSQDREVAMLMGINIKRLSMLAVAISASFAAIAGVLILSTTGGKVTSPTVWLEPLYMSFAIVILGGLGSIKGAFVGAFIIGYVHQLFLYGIDPIIVELMGTVPGDTLGTAFIMGAMLLVLIIRPKGLFGKRVELED